MNKHRNANIVVLILLMFIAGIALFAAPCAYADSPRPTVLVFDVNADEDVDPGLIDIATRAIREYFRQNGKVEAVMFDIKSPLVARAVLEKSIMPEAAQNYDSQKIRTDITAALALDFACGAIMHIEQEKVRMSMWLIDSANPKRKWEVKDYVASGGRIDETGLRNAIHSVTSGLVNEISRLAFAEVVAENPAPTAVVDISPAPAKVADGGKSAQEIGNAAADNLRQGNTAKAIDLYQKSINADPSNYTLRIKLAEVYRKRGMDKEAADELDRALTLGADPAAIEAARLRIFKPDDAELGPVEVAVSPESGSTQTSKPETPRTTSEVQPSAVYVPAAIAEGDKLWNLGDAQGAQQVYVQVIQNDPADWLAYERLAILLAAQYKFSEASRVLSELNSVQSSPPANVLRNRYAWLTGVLDYGVNALLGQMESDIASFETHRISRQDCYESIRSAKLQLQDLVNFTSELLYPVELRQANATRLRACRYGLQAATGLQEYLETDLAKYKNNASVFIEQARTELLDISKTKQEQS